MLIFVQSVDRVFPVTVDINGTVEDLKKKIEDHEFVPAGIQRISKGSEYLCGSLSGLLFDADTVVMNLDVNGGMRAKWRKKRMRRLRRKRRKMRHRAR